MDPDLICAFHSHIFLTFLFLLPVQLFLVVTEASNVIGTPGKYNSQVESAFFLVFPSINLFGL